MIWIVTGILLIVLGYLIHLKVTESSTFWKKRNIPYYEFLGPYQTIFLRLLKSHTITEEFHANYLAYPDKKCYGVNIFKTPHLLIRDPELIRNVAIKDFDHFTDHRDFISPDSNDKIMTKNLFGLKGKQWHSMRTILSPSFTGSKLRGIFQLMSACGEQLVHYLQSECEKQENGAPLQLEFKDLTTRVTNDIVATTVFGIKINSLQDRSNKFYMMGRTTTSVSPLRLFFVFYIPLIAKYLRITFISATVYKFFSQLISDTIRIRREQNIVRPDMINLLLEAQKEQIKNSQTSKEGEKIIVLTDEDIMAQAFVFFFAGFDTVAVAMSLVSYELAVNPDVQEKLYNEIQKVLKSSDDGKITYEDLRKMKYLDMVVSESLRKWPPTPGIDRRCTKDYTLKFDHEEIFIEKGLTLSIPIYGVHRDEKYYPDSEKFIPERFSDENKENIKPFIYMPFGIGPRQCIANRFAIMEVKVFLIHLVGNFKLEVIKKTPIPMVLKPNSINLDAKDGFWLGIKARK